MLPELGHPMSNGLIAVELESLRMKLFDTPWTVNLTPGELEIV